MQLCIFHKPFKATSLNHKETHRQTTPPKMFNDSKRFLVGKILVITQQTVPGR